MTMQSNSAARRPICSLETDRCEEEREREKRINVKSIRKEKGKTNVKDF